MNKKTKRYKPKKKDPYISKPPVIRDASKQLNDLLKPVGKPWLLNALFSSQGYYTVGCVCFYLNAPLSRGCFVVSAKGPLDAIELAVNFGKQENELLKAIFVCEGHRKTVDYSDVVNHL